MQLQAHLMERWSTMLPEAIICIHDDSIFLVIWAGPEVVQAARVLMINRGDRLQGACMFIRHISIQTYCQIAKPLQFRL